MGGSSMPKERPRSVISIPSNWACRARISRGKAATTSVAPGWSVAKVGRNSVTSLQDAGSTLRSDDS
eukprot:4369114-Alexandrium_andersonii.AAC.1